MPEAGVQRSKPMLRSSDLVARYGGEEFAMVLPHTPRAAAVRVAERVRSKVEAAALPHAASPVCGQVTLSIGVACITLRNHYVLPLRHRSSEPRRHQRSLSRIRVHPLACPLVEKPSTAHALFENSSHLTARRALPLSQPSVSFRMSGKAMARTALRMMSVAGRGVAGAI
jgi:predicted signal transduction protein with EAL and GGDEF domain